MDLTARHQRIRRQWPRLKPKFAVWFVVVLLLRESCYSTAFSSHHASSGARIMISHTKSVSLHAKTTESSVGRVATPRHVAFICDGNSRWAEARGLPASIGHAAGADRLVECVQSLRQEGVEYCTMYGFSTENWKRSDREIRDILTVIEQTANAFKTWAMNEHVCVKILGNMNDPRIPRSLHDALISLEHDTYSSAAARSVDGRMTICLAINYGGRQDIVNASLQLAKAISAGDIDPSDVSENDFGRFLYTADIPDPDFVIRTGGDQRLSNFLLWNLAYAELYFTDVLWPDLDRTELIKALTWFSSRSRRFGGRLETAAQRRP
jgi:undecaprenyl diphosphate synthase